MEHYTTLILGAGIAGLAAARTLHDTGHTGTLVLEARDRIGGRVHTTELAPGVPIDLGASWIHGAHGGNPITEACERFDIPTVPSDLDSNAYFDADGSPLPDAHAAKLIRNNEALFSELDRWIDAQPYDSNVRALVDSFYRQRSTPLPPEQRRAFEWALAQEELDTGGPLSELSAWSWDEDGAFPGPDRLFPNGYTALPHALAQGLDVRTQHTASVITHDREGVTIATNHGLFRAENAIITLPIGCLQQDTVRFSPPLPKWKRRSIHRLGAGRLDKIAMRFEAPFWDTDREFLHPITSPPTFTDFWRFEKHCGQPVLIAFVGGRFGRDLIDTHTDDAIISATLDALRHLYGDRVTQPTHTHITRWSRDPLSRCAYTFIPHKARLKDCDNLAQPLGRLLFAGEATHDTYPGTVHGAWLSGVRAAESIADSSPR